jgi:hypothetical protein
MMELSFKGALFTLLTIVIPQSANIHTITMTEPFAILL